MFHDQRRFQRDTTQSGSKSDPSLNYSENKVKIFLQKDVDSLEELLLMLTG